LTLTLHYDDVRKNNKENPDRAECFVRAEAHLTVALETLRLPFETFPVFNIKSISAGVIANLRRAVSGRRGHVLLRKARVRGEADRRCVRRRATEIQQRPGPSGSVTFDSSLARFPDEGNRGHGCPLSSSDFDRRAIFYAHVSGSSFCLFSLLSFFSFCPPIIWRYRNESLLCGQNVLADCQD